MCCVQGLLPKGRQMRGNKEKRGGKGEKERQKAVFVSTRFSGQAAHSGMLVLWVVGGISVCPGRP